MRDVTASYASIYNSDGTYTYLRWLVTTDHIVNLNNITNMALNDRINNLSNRLGHARVYKKNIFDGSEIEFMVGNYYAFQETTVQIFIPGYIPIIATINVNNDKEINATDDISFVTVSQTDSSCTPINIPYSINGANIKLYFNNFLDDDKKSFTESYYMTSVIVTY